MDQDTIGKVADATKAVAETSDTALKVVGKFGSYFPIVSWSTFAPPTRAYQITTWSYLK